MGGAVGAGARIMRKEKNESAGDCLHVVSPPPTPDNIKRYRRSQFGPGQRQIHYGVLRDEQSKQLRVSQLPPSQQIYGCGTKASDHVNDLFEGAKLSAADQTLIDIKERTYRESNVVLGKAKGFGHVLPAQTQTKDFAFGVKESASTSAKNLLYPEDDGTDLNPAVYLKSHHAYPPSAQVDRNYNWESAKLNPTQHRFGKATQKHKFDSTSACLDRTGAQRYKIVSKSQGDFMSYKPKLGQIKDHGLSINNPEHIYGLPSDPRATGKEWNAGDCLRGNYDLDEQQPDTDLGRRTIRGSAITTMDRAFGCPSMRDDIVPPKKRSVADMRNFGTDPGAKNLIAPTQFVNIGISETDFSKQRAPSEIRTIFEAAGDGLTDDTFMRVWWRAATGYDLNKDNIVSVAEFRDALDEYQRARENNAVPSWWDEAKFKGPAQLQSDIQDSRK